MEFSGPKVVVDSSSSPKNQVSEVLEEEARTKRPRDQDGEDEGSELQQFFALVDGIHELNKNVKIGRQNVIFKVDKSPLKLSFEWQDFCNSSLQDISHEPKDLVCGTSNNGVISEGSQIGNIGYSERDRIRVETIDLNAPPASETDF